MLTTQETPEGPPDHDPRASGRSHLDRRANRVVWAASLLFGIWMLAMLFSLQRRYGTQTFDMAIFDQGIWLLSRFKEPFVTIRGLNLFADHTSYILVLISPLYWVFDGVNVLMFVSVGALAAGGPLTYAIARRSGLGTGLSTGLAIAYLLHPTVAWNAWDLFHPEVLAVPLLLGAYLLVLRDRWRWALTLLVLTLTVKEDAALVVVPLGIFLAWRFKRSREGLGIAAFGVALMSFNILVVLPGLSPTGELTNNWRYSQFGPGIGGALRGMVTKPGLLISELFGSDRLTYYAQMLGPVPTALLAPEMLLIAIPITAANVLSSHVHQYEIEFHYTSYALAIMTIAAISGAARLATLLKGRQAVVGSIVIMAAVVGSALVSPWPQLRQDDPWRGSAHGSENVAALDEALALIPADAGVAADWFTVTHLAERVDAYMLPNPFQNRYYGAGEPYTPSHEDVDWVVAQRWALGDTEVQFVFEALRRSPDWETAVDDDFVLVMKRRDAPFR